MLRPWLQQRPKTWHGAKLPQLPQLPQRKHCSTCDVLLYASDAYCVEHDAHALHG